MTKEEAIKRIKTLRLKIDEPTDISLGRLESWIYKEDVEAFDMAIKALEQQPSEDKVSLGVYEQVRWERDVAIEQLKELGYSLGEKIRTSEDCVSRQAVKDIIHEYKNNIDSQLSWLSDGVCNLPSVTPKIATSDDCVSRQEVLDLMQLKMGGKELYKAVYDLPPVTPTFPKDTTNGDVIKAMFPNIKIHEHEKTDICDAYIQIDIWDFSIYVSKDWWNEPYKGGNTDDSNKK